MRHKKIPSKNRKKLKSVDPFNRKGAALRAEATKKLNWVPKNSDADQPMSKNLQELQEMITQGSSTATFPKKRAQKKSKVLVEAEKVGLYRRRFEGMKQFIKRVERNTYFAVQEHKLLVEQGKTGRDQSEIDAEMKALDDKEKRAKDQKKREVQKAIEKARKERAAAATAFEEKEEAKRKRREERRRQEMGEDEEEGEEEEEGQESEEEERKEEPKKKVKQPAKKVFGVPKKPPVNEAIINRREIVKFGERYDAPPQFGGPLKGKLDPLTAKAGGKNLLLHSLLKKSTEEGATYLERDDKKRSANEMERQRVIDAYRDIKKMRRARGLVEEDGDERSL